MLGRGLLLGLCGGLGCLLGLGFLKGGGAGRDLRGGGCAVLYLGLVLVLGFGFGNEMKVGLWMRVERRLSRCGE
jgi:hypothetical protein